MSSVNVMNKDESAVNPENKVIGEVLLVTKGIPQNLTHSIFFKTSFLYTQIRMTEQARF